MAVSILFKRSSSFRAFVQSNTIKFTGYRYSRCFGVEEKAKKGPHFSLMLARNYRMESGKVEEISWEVVHRRNQRGPDVPNFPDILFTEKRDYLVKYNGQQVYADQVAGKVVVLFFVPLLPINICTRRCMISLVDTYNYLLQYNNFEVVFVAVDSTCKELSFGNNKIKVDPPKHFEELFSCMPWTAIPFSDKEASKCLQDRFDISSFGMPTMCRNAIVIDANGKVLQTDSYLFEAYGGQGYPFSDTKILSLESQDDAIAKNPSLGALLCSPGRDYVISNKGDKVPIHTLEEKVVALLFYEDRYTDRFTEILKMAYEELTKKKENFEVVLIYNYDSDWTCGCTDEGSFWEKFRTMPWLALPFRDLNYRKLLRLICYPPYKDPEYVATRLVIVGPRGKFIEPWGEYVLMQYKLEAFPFSREKVAQLEIEKVKELKLEMLWGPNTVFRRKDETKVQLSQLAGKRIMLFFESNKFDQDVAKFLKMLKELYLNMRGTDAEFEVIYISYSKNESCYSEYVRDVSWLESPAIELLSADYLLYCCFGQWTHLQYGIDGFPGKCHEHSSVLAFDQDGRLVRKSIYPTIEHLDFPFYAGSMEKEAFFNYNDFFGFSLYNYQGLLRNLYCHHDQAPPINLYHHLEY